MFFSNEITIEINWEGKGDIIDKEMEGEGVDNLFIIERTE